jgi:hypothetical protein
MADGRYDQYRERDGGRSGRGTDEGRDWQRVDERSRDWGRGQQGGENWHGGQQGDQNWGQQGDRNSGSRDAPNRGWTASHHDRGGWQGSGRGDQDRSGTMFGWGEDRDEDDDRGRGGSRNQARREDHGFGYDDRHEGLPIEETSRVIASNKVEGTAVYGRDSHRLGSIYNFMVDKRSGKVEYAVMTYGGFLGMGTRYYPLPWDILSYDTRLGGYRVEMVERDLERAPSFDRSTEPSFDTSYGRRVRGWYGLGSR